MPDDPPLAHLLQRLLRWFDYGVVNLMSERGHASIKRSHALVMANLDAEGRSESEIARRAGVSRQAIHQIVKELKELDMVTTRPDERDRRVRVVVPTAYGATATADALAVLRELEADLAARLTPTHLAALRAALAVDPGEPPTGAAAADRPAPRHPPRPVTDPPAH